MASMTERTIEQLQKWFNTLAEIADPTPAMVNTAWQIEREIKNRNI